MAGRGLEIHSYNENIEQKPENLDTKQKEHIGKTNDYANKYPEIADKLGEQTAKKIDDLRNPSYIDKKNLSNTLKNLPDGVINNFDISDLQSQKTFNKIFEGQAFKNGEFISGKNQNGEKINYNLNTHTITKQPNFKEHNNPPKRGGLFERG